MISAPAGWVFSDQRTCFFSGGVAGTTAPAPGRVVGLPVPRSCCSDTASSAPSSTAPDSTAISGLREALATGTASAARSPVLVFSVEGWLTKPLLSLLGCGIPPAAAAAAETAAISTLTVGITESESAEAPPSSSERSWMPSSCRLGVEGSSTSACGGSSKSASVACSCCSSSDSAAIVGRWSLSLTSSRPTSATMLGGSHGANSVSDGGGS